MTSKKSDLIVDPIVQRFPPMDFYRFKHTTWSHRPPTHMASWKAPYWIVGISPFDEQSLVGDGYITHLGSPRFVARWTLDEAKFHLGNNQPHFLDEDVGLLVYEISLLDEFTRDLDEWLFEAACAVAFSRGLICAMDAIEEAT